MLHSCPAAFRGNYDDEVHTFWRAFFGALPDGARVLDIGTGNGAIAFLARDAATANGRRLHVEGIDAAVIRPADAAGRLGIEVGDIVFRGETNCERTGYPGAHFDGASSQYAIEYARAPEALAELARILKPGGRAAFLMHHAGSRATDATRAELKAFHFLRHEAPLLARMRGLFRKLGDVEGGNQLAHRLADRDTRKHAKEIERLQKRAADYGHSHPQAGFVEAIALHSSRILQQMIDSSPADASMSLALLEQEAAAHEARLRANLSAAKSAAGISEFCSLARECGFEVGTADELRRQGEDLLGWTIVATRET